MMSLCSILGNKNGVTAAAATDNLHGDGGKCNISNNPHQTYQCGIGPLGCDISVRFNICQPFSTFPYYKVGSFTRAFNTLYFHL